MIALKFVILLACVLLGYSLGFLFTETNHALINYGRFFDFEAFKCRKCLSTHIAWVSSTFFSLLFGDLIMLGFGIIFAGALFLGLRIDEKNKTIKIEDYDDYK